MGYSRRDYTTQEERTQAVIDREKNKRSNKLSDYLSQPNVKQFNALVVDKSFSRLKNNMGRPQIFKSREECLEEVESYFKLCYDYNMLPTIATMALYLGYNRDSLYANASNLACSFSDILKNAIATCQAYQETPAVDGTLSAPVWIFTAKNYFNMQDNQNINILATNQTQNNPNTINAIKEQIAQEQNKTIKEIDIPT